MLIEVAFKGNRKEFFLWHEESLPALKTPVVVEADRGEDLGYVNAQGELATKRAAGCAHGPGAEPVTQRTRRVATEDDLRRFRELRDQDEVARRKAMERVRANNLSMKLTDAEWRWDRKKLTFYFTADRRVDFRNLVRELAAMFRTRIELKQIGVRDEAKRLSGIGRCGRVYCSASWLPELRPVNLGVAKDQRLSLNPSQISGACGRLMCCLRYEHDFYVKQRKRFPKEGKTVTTQHGEEKVMANDIFRERVTLRSSEGELRVLTLAEFRRESGWGSTMEMPLEEDTPVVAMEALTDEVIRLQDTSERPKWEPRRDRGAPPGRERPPARALPVVEARAPEPAAPNEEVLAAETEADVETDADTEADAEAEVEETGPTGERRRRRRRGRRGGRRGRRGGDRNRPAGPGQPGTGDEPPAPGGSREPGQGS